MTWDLASPRACKPSAELENAAYVVRGGPLHALHSPLPYGLGVYSVDSTGTRKALPLYYVSEKVARARGRGVKEGWYVVAVPGVEFELAVTAVQQNFPRIQDEPLKDGYDTRARLIVDGMHVRSYKNYMGCGYERRAVGFIESQEFGDTARSGEATVRKFAFQKAETVEDEFKVTGDTVGSIMVQMSYGKLQKRVLGSSSATADLARSSQAVAEKEAAKTGKSIKVDRQGEKMKMSKTRSRYHIPSSHHAGTFIVFIREQFWMQSRQLIDADGQPVMQTGDAPAIVIDDDRDDEGENEVGSKRKTPEGSGNALEKKAKLDSNAVDNPTT